ncbi:hypothetical protein LOC59_12260 [Arthrobacter sp. zg-Y916]|uniref:hypothetical protein n=1 Tax=Arthrobacter sp. zg-Y916 TaxID=2894190 RepID=UPI001E3F0BEC|nr:hypothetical protein [Arthrobacter sp. zg-Y916]MCC9194412.1 hypothetical protein [Arthrobacter sp. zg-Y916]
MNWGNFWTAVSDWAITWIPVLGPLGILTTALVAYFAYRQKLEADRRAQWWVRAQWALEASLSANPRRSLAGLAVLNDLKTSSLATREDRELFRLIALTARDELLGEAAPPASVRAREAAGSGSGDRTVLATRILEQAHLLLGSAEPEMRPPGTRLPGTRGAAPTGPPPPSRQEEPSA